MSGPWLRACAPLGLILALASTGRAQSALDTPEASDGPSITPLAAAEASSESLPWWPWLATAPLMGATFALAFTGHPTRARWSGAGPVDDAFSSWTASSAAGRARAARASDILMFASAAAPLVDVLAWPSRGLSRSRTRYRLMTVDSLAFAVQGIFIMGTKRAFGRARPYDVPCRENENYEGPCESSSRFESFISGHTAVAFTGASLVCAHQRLRGRTIAGHIECASALAMASFTGALRIVSERHYFTDILGGAAVGFLAGYLLPLLLYPRPDPPVDESRAMAW